MATDYVVEMLNINKSFGGLQALKDVSFSLERGEFHALVGENGAGKSTLMKIMSGAYQNDSGVIKIDGEPVSINNPQIGRKLGIGIIYQEFALAPDLTVAENIYLAQLREQGRLVNWKKLFKQADNLIESLGFEIDSRTLVGNLNVAYQQVVEIAKALSRQTKVLILDEPTAVLSPSEAENLFKVLLKLKEQGVSIVYISHRLEEIFRLSDRITVFKDGTKVGSVLPSEITRKNLIQMMIGRNLEAFFPVRNVDLGEVILQVDDVSSGTKVKHASFSLRAGEVLGIAGLMGSGRTELVRTIFGIDRKDNGSIKLRGKPLRIKSPKNAVEHGIVLVPESRKEHGVLLTMSVIKNINLPNMKRVTGLFGTIRKKEEVRIAQDLVEKLRIKTNTVYTEVGHLSGGNQQKVVIAKWYTTDCSVVIFDEPSRGVDVGAKVEIYNLINELVAKGTGVIMISSDMMEVIGMCDRVLVIKDGAIQISLDKPEISEENIMRYAIGG